MGRTATFKSGERYIRPTGSASPVEAVEDNTENALFRQVDESGNPVTTTQTEGDKGLTPVTVIDEATIPSEIDERNAAAAVDPEAPFEPSETELKQFQSLLDDGVAEEEAAATVWPGVVFDGDDLDAPEEAEEDNSEAESVTEVPVEENSEGGSTDETVQSEEAPAEEVPAEQAYPEGNPTSQWKVGELEAYAADHDIEVSGTRNEKYAQIRAVLDADTQEA